MANDPSHDSGRFLLVSMSTVGGPSGLRVTVWRTLRALGGLYLQQSVCLLPDRADVARAARRLLAQVQAKGGTGQVLTIAIPEPGERAGIVAQFNAERDAEYAEILERTPALLEELATETARGSVTYAEVEESEADLDRFRTWIAKVDARDYFSAPGRAAAQAAIDRCAAALADFEAAAVAAETGTTREP